MTQERSRPASSSRLAICQFSCRGGGALANIDSKINVVPRLTELLASETEHVSPTAASMLMLLGRPGEKQRRHLRLEAGVDANRKPSPSQTIVDFMKQPRPRNGVLGP